jgi:hypothetical protein
VIELIMTERNEESAVAQNQSRALEGQTDALPLLRIEKNEGPKPPKIAKGK